MTILWDLDPRASNSYGFALGPDAIQIFAPGQVGKALQEGNHQLVVIGPDIDLDAACSLAELERIDRPELGVILLRHRVDVTTLSQALRSGVREVVQVGDQTALSDAIKRSLELSSQITGHAQSSAGPHGGKVITVFSAKGGVGKTTLATNLATYLATTGAKTLIVDLDLMFGDVAISLQVMPAHGIGDLVSMRGHLDEQGVQSVVIRHEDSGLDIIAAPSDPGVADRIPAAVVEELIRVARGTYTYIIVDTPPNLTEHVLTACDLSDLTLLVATLDIPAVKNLRVAMNTLDTLGASTDGRLVVLNRSDAKVGLKADDVEVALKHRIAAQVPSSQAVPASVNRGVPLVLDDPRSPVSSAVREIADREIRARFGEEIQHGAKRGFGLLKGRK